MELGSRILDPTTTKRGGGKIICSLNFFVALNFTKDLSQLTKNLSMLKLFLFLNIFTKLSELHGLDPGSEKKTFLAFPVRIQGSKLPHSGSGFSTLAIL
jgi:hypothetical protein